MRKINLRGLLAAISIAATLSTGTVLAQEVLFGEGQNPDVRVEVRDLKRATAAWSRCG